MKKTKGIILAGGSGTRLHPITMGVSKQLLPIYDKPMIYYPISTLMQAHIEDILIISTPFDMPSFKNLLGDGSQFGVNLTYVEQSQPDGIAQAFLLGETFLGNDNVCLILGDNIFSGPGIEDLLIKTKKRSMGGTIFGSIVPDPCRFGVAELDENNQIISIEEKPNQPKSNIAITGLYFYDNNVIDISKELKPSKRNELEITDVHNAYLETNELYLEILSQDFTWLDTGTYDSLINAGKFVQSEQKSHNNYIGCLEEIAYRNQWISKDELRKSINLYSKTSYGQYIKKLLDG